MDKRNILGEYLRARRGIITPREAGIPDLGRRRVPGLRRDEVAHLAGISADYYLRLERGRDRHPSTQVLESIAHALQLDDETLAYLLALAADQPKRRRHQSPPPEVAPSGTLKLLASLSHPAFVEGCYFDILAANPMAAALSPRLTAGRNQLRDIFLEPEDKSLHEGWDSITECLAASLRHAVGTDFDDPRFTELVTELSLASRRFRELWPRHDIGIQRGTQVVFAHPQVGKLRLNREHLAVSGTSGVHVVIYHADEGTPDGDKLASLAGRVDT